MAKAKKLPSGKWRVQAKRTVFGVHEIKSFTANTKTAAETAAILWQNEQSPTTISKMTLAEAYDKYIEAKENILSPSTIRSYKVMRNHTLKSLMGCPIDKCTPQAVQVAINHLAADHSPKYVRNAYNLFTAVMSMFCPSWSAKITLPEKKKTDMYIPDDEAVAKLIKEVEGARLEIPILLAAFGPMRRGEICALTSDDIKGNIVTVNKSMVRCGNGEYKIKPPKNYSSNRNIEFPDFVIDKIKDIEGSIVDMTPSALSDAFQRLVIKLDMPHFRFHDLRHYAVSSLHAINVPDKYIMARGGWSTNHTMNNVYNHILKKEKDKNEEKIIDHFNKVFTTKNV